MYNGGNGNGNGNGKPGRGGPYAPSGNTGNVFTIGQFGIKPLYVYIGVGIVILSLIYFFTRMINTSLVMHFGLAAGALLLWANGRAFLVNTPSYVYVQAPPDKSIALLNTLVGGALMAAWLSQIVSVFLWLPALVFFGLAMPLALDKTNYYDKYAQTATRVTDKVRQVISRF